MRDLGDVYWSAGLLLILALAMFAGLFVARALRSRFGGTEASAPFTLQDLREMRSAGQITQEEYDTMRAGLLGQMGRPSAPRPPEDPPSANGLGPAEDKP